MDRRIERQNIRLNKIWNHMSQNKIFKNHFLSQKLSFQGMIDTSKTMKFRFLFNSLSLSLSLASSSKIRKFQIVPYVRKLIR